MGKSGEKKWWRNIILGVIAIGLTIGIIHLLDTMIYGRKVEYVEAERVFTQLPVELNGYTIALVTDTHSISEENLVEIRQEIERRQPDIVLLGGDYQRSIERVPRILGSIHCPDGVISVEGNHDITQEWVESFEEHDVPMLYNSGQEIRSGLYIAGTADLWSNKSDAEQALAGRKEGDFTILLAHNPDTAMDEKAENADLVVSGHTHGGHATFFGVWKPLLYSVTKYGHRFGGGWSTGVNDVPVYVSRGAGYYRNWMSPRVFSRPEITFITLRAKKTE